MAPTRGAVECQLRFDGRVINTRYRHLRRSSHLYSLKCLHLRRRDHTDSFLRVCFVSWTVCDKLSLFRARAEGKIKLYKLCPSCFRRHYYEERSRAWKVRQQTRCKSTVVMHRVNRCQMKTIWLYHHHHLFARKTDTNMQ